MYPMSMSPEGVTDDEISAASMSETDTSLLNSASLPAMDDDQSESNSETNNDSASGKKSVNTTYNKYQKYLTPCSFFC